jgi:hypothetical protein
MLMLQKRTLFGLIILMAGMELGFAQQAEEGFYAGGRWGLSTLATPTERDRPGAGLKAYDRSSQAWSLFLGHQWKVAPQVLFGAELGWTDNGRATITYASANEYEFKSTELDLLGNATVILGRGLSVFAKAGMGRVRQEYHNSKYVSGTPDLDSQWTRDLPVAAAGLSCAITGHLNVFAEVRRTFGDRTDLISKALTASNPTPPPYRDILTSVARVDVLSLGLSWSF